MQTKASSRRLIPASRAMLLLIAVIVGLGPLSTDLYLPAMPMIQQALGATTSEVQLSLSVFMVGFAFSQLFWGPVSDRIGRWPCLAIGQAIYVIASLGCSMTNDIDLIIVGRFFQAFGVCSGTVVGRAMIRDIYEGAEAAKMLGYISSIMGLAPAAAPFIGGYIAAWFGWSATFWSLALIGSLMLVTHLLIVPETIRHKNEDATRPGPLMRNYLMLFKNRPYRFYMGVSAFTFSGFFCYLGGLPFWLNDALAYDEKDFGLLFLPGVIGYIGGAFIGGKLVGRFGINRLLGFGIAICLLAGALITGTWFAGPFDDRFWQMMTVIAPFTIYTTGMGMVFPQSLAGAALGWPNIAGTAAALIGFVQMAFASLFGAIAIRFYDGTSLPLTVTTVICAVMALVFFLLVLRATRDRPAFPG